jgi:hypothetical protein
MKTDEINKEIYEGTKRRNFCSSLSQTPPNSHKVNVYCCWLVELRDRVIYVECVTVQHIYCTNTVQTVQSATELY